MKFGTNETIKTSSKLTTETENGIKSHLCIQQQQIKSVAERRVRSTPSGQHVEKLSPSHWDELPVFQLFLGPTVTPC